MNNLFGPKLILASFLFSSLAAFAEGKKKEEWHCEKKDKDGKVTDIEASSKDDCKKKGGKWKKGHDDDHKDGDGHKHE